MIDEISVAYPKIDSEAHWIFLSLLCAPCFKIIPGMQHQRKVYVPSLQERQQFLSIAQKLGQFLLDCVHSHEEG
jgi:hypothetical protein